MTDNALIARMPSDRFWLLPDGRVWSGREAKFVERESDGSETHLSSLSDLTPSLRAQFSGAIQAHLDATASQRRYDSIHTAISYRDDPNPKFAAEAAALFSWRSAVWTYATDELDKVVTGERAIPTVQEFLAELPELVWPSAD